MSNNDKKNLVYAAGIIGIIWSIGLILLLTYLLIAIAISGGLDISYLSLLTLIAFIVLFCFAQIIFSALSLKEAKNDKSISDTTIAGLIASSAFTMNIFTLILIIIATLSSKTDNIN